MFFVSPFTGGQLKYTKYVCRISWKHAIHARFLFLLPNTRNVRKINKNQLFNTSFIAQFERWLIAYAILLLLFCRFSISKYFNKVKWIHFNQRNFGRLQLLMMLNLFWLGTNHFQTEKQSTRAMTNYLYTNTFLFKSRNIYTYSVEMLDGRDDMWLIQNQNEIQDPITLF